MPPSSGKDYVIQCVEKMKEIGVGKIATVMGRYYAMDRDNRWERVEKAYAAMAYGEGVKCADPVEAVEQSYKQDVTDEFVVPVVCEENAQVSAGDSVIFFNFRPDRAREITRCFVDPEFKGFERKKGFFPLTYICMTQYDATMPNVEVAFKPQSLANTFGEYVSDKGMTQLRIAETEKYAHVTFFFNGGVEKQYPGEDRVLVNSPKVATYDMQPEMSAYEVTDKCVERIESGKYDVIILNFANCDMVGHTGVFEAAVAAVEAVDTCVGRVTDAIAKMGGISLITADHGNADKMVAQDGEPFTAHTTNPVPFCVIGYPCELREGGKLADIAPTMLKSWVYRSRLKWTAKVLSNNKTAQRRPGGFPRRGVLYAYEMPCKAQVSRLTVFQGRKRVLPFSSRLPPYSCRAIKTARWRFHILPASIKCPSKS